MTSRYNEPWTQEEVSRLGELAASTSVASIAAELGRTEDAVRSKAYKENISFGATSGEGVTDYADELVEETVVCVREWTGAAMLSAAAGGLLLGLFIGGRRGSGGDKATRRSFARIREAFDRGIPQK